MRPRPCTTAFGTLTTTHRTARPSIPHPAPGTTVRGRPLYHPHPCLHRTGVSLGTARQGTIVRRHGVVPVETLGRTHRAMSTTRTPLPAVPSPIAASTSDLFPADYVFPTDKLAPFREGSTLTPLVLVACGSFSPVTHLHLRMFEMARDRIMQQKSQRYYLLGAYFSPVSDAYGKKELARGTHRIAMCQAAVADSPYLMVDGWEAMQPHYKRTALVLDHFDAYLNTVYQADRKEADRQRIRIMLLAGGDLIESFADESVWSPRDLDYLLDRYGVLIVERTGCDIKEFLLTHDLLYKHRANLMIVKQYIYNDISSTKIRLFLKRGLSVKYLLPEAVIDYIHKHGVYDDLM